MKNKHATIFIYKFTEMPKNSDRRTDVFCRKLLLYIIVSILISFNDGIEITGEEFTKVDANYYGRREKCTPSHALFMM